MSKVVQGDYINHAVIEKKTFLGKSEGFFIQRTLHKDIPLTKETIKSWSILSESDNKDASSMFGRALVGGMLFGGIGLLGGALTAKSKGAGIVVDFIDGKKSLIQMDKDMFLSFQFSLGNLEKK